MNKHDLEELVTTLRPYGLRVTHPLDPAEENTSFDGRLGPFLLTGTTWDHPEAGHVWVAVSHTFDKWGNSRDWCVRALPTPAHTAAFLAELLKEYNAGLFSPGWAETRDLTAVVSRQARSYRTPEEQAAVQASYQELRRTNSRAQARLVRDTRKARRAKPTADRGPQRHT